MTVDDDFENHSVQVSTHPNPVTGRSAGFVPSHQITGLEGLISTSKREDKPYAILENYIIPKLDSETGLLTRISNATTALLARSLLDSPSSPAPTSQG